MFNDPIPYEVQYLRVLQHLVNHSQIIEMDRTGTGTTREFGLQLSHDLRTGFPLLTTKRVFWRGVVEELLWFLRGETNIKPLTDKGVHIWDDFADEAGELGPVYGAQWRSWPSPTNLRADRYTFEQIATMGSIDQIANLLHELRTNPASRRMIVSAWNPALLPDPERHPKVNAASGLQALPPCHTMFQLAAKRMTKIDRVAWVAANNRNDCRGLNDEQMTARGVPEYYLDLQLYQRSADWMLGVPFNVASYALLLHIIAKMVNMAPRRFIHTFGDVHLYANHIEQAQEQLSRNLKHMPNVDVNVAGISDPGELRFENITLSDYDAHPAIKAPVAV